jgi:hypothetical protein
MMNVTRQQLHIQRGQRAKATGRKSYRLCDLQDGMRFRTVSRRRVLTKRNEWSTLPIWDPEKGKPYVVGYKAAALVCNSSGRTSVMDLATEIIKV